MHFPVASPSLSLQELVALTLPTFIILVSLALVTDCYVIPSLFPVILILLCRLNAVVPLGYRPRILSPSKGATAPCRCAGASTGATIADVIAVAVVSNCGALVRIIEWCPSIGGIVNNGGSNGAGPPDDAQLSCPFPPYHHVLQHAHSPSVDGHDDVTQCDPSPERACRIDLCYPRATPLAMDGKGKSQLAGGHDNHEWQSMQRWGCKALPSRGRSAVDRETVVCQAPSSVIPSPRFSFFPGP